MKTERNIVLRGLSSTWLGCALALSLSLYGGAIYAPDFSSNATVINFDNLTGGDCNLCGPSVTSQYAALGVTFNNPSYPGDDTADSNLTSSITNASSPNALYVHQGGLLDETPASPFEILFSVPVTTVGFDYGSSTDSYLELDAYGAGNQLLETETFVGTPSAIGLAGFAGLQEAEPIVELDVSYHPDSDPSRTLNFSIDNLEFQGSPVPEPSTGAFVAMASLGIALGQLYRSSRQRQTREPTTDQK